MSRMLPALALVSVLGAGCALNGMTIPTTPDETPPVVVFEVHVDGERYTLGSGPGADVEVRLRKNSRVWMRAMARDLDSAIASVEILGATRVACATAEGEEVYEGEFLGDYHDGAKLPGDRARGARVAELTIDAEELMQVCASGEVYGAEGRIWAAAQNHHGLGSASHSVWFTMVNDCGCAGACSCD